jgi:peptidoglycan hydrolase-like protein with peptidoglycan-binding domain
MKRFYTRALGVALAASSIAALGVPAVQAAIDRELGIGSRGTEVTELQQFLATNNAIYPAALITGYFGGMTRDAVVQLQAAYGIAQVGRVGPQTLAKINAVMASGQGLDINAPNMSSPVLSTQSTSATLTWTTGELARGQVFYNSQPIQAEEATGQLQIPYVSGNLVSSGTALSTSHSLTIQGLQANTVYYYLTRSIDASGNVSMTLPSSFRTNN